MRLINADERIARWKAAMLHMVKDDNGKHSISMETLIKDLENAPTIEAEPVKHGRWELVVYKPIGHDYFCSLCNFAACNKHSYCPHCGAKMDLEG